MRWTDDLSTGIPSLDRQHQLLFRMVGDYREALDEGRGESVFDLFLESLERYARAHFSQEEECMTRYACPAAELNVSAHRDFSERLAQSTQQFRARGFDRGDANALLAMLEGWLLGHVARVDTQLRPLAGAAPQRTTS